MKVEVWKDIYSIRFDLSLILWHLTKPNTVSGETRTPFQIIKKILESRIIKGSNSYVFGSENVVSFMDVPLYLLPQVIRAREEYNENPSFTYDTYGIGIDKREVYLKGGRPIIYLDDKTRQAILKEEDYWRCVTFDLTEDNQAGLIDWSHEREWRVKGDFKLEQPDKTIVIVKDLKEIEELKKEFQDNLPFSVALPWGILESYL